MRRREFITLLGGAAAWPLAASAQQSERVRRVAILTGSAANDPNNVAWIGAFLFGLEQIGWKQGRNLHIELRGAGGDSSRIQGLANELVRLSPDVIFTTSTPTAAALMRETRIIPIVFTNVSDPLGSGLVPSLAYPGGNTTGFTNFEFGIGGKWLQALKELAPHTRRSSLVFNPVTAPYAAGYVQSFQAAATSSGVEPTISPINVISEIEAVARAQSSEPGGCMVVVPDIFTVANRQPIISASTRHRLPTMYPYGVMAVDGGLIAYGPEIADLFRRAASYVDRILKGEKPGELPVMPVQQPTKFELVINLKTAKALGLEVPFTLLARADEVIE